MARTRLAILYGGRSAEHQVSVVSACSVMEALDPDRFEVVPIAITREGAWMLPERSPLELTAADGTLPEVEAKSASGPKPSWPSHRPTVGPTRPRGSPR